MLFRSLEVPHNTHSAVQGLRSLIERAHRVRVRGSVRRRSDRVKLLARLLSQGLDRFADMFRPDPVERQRQREAK